jgi:hypothetical protein
VVRPVGKVARVAEICSGAGGRQKFAEDFGGSVALTVGKTDAGLSDDARCLPTPDDAAEAGIRQVPISA